MTRNDRKNWRSGLYCLLRLFLRFILIARTLLAGILLVAPPGAALAQSRLPPARPDTAADPTALDPGADIVVTARRRQGIAPKDVASTIPAPVIKAYAADSIGELLIRLSARFGPNISIVVNGRRLAATDAIRALPPEALERIEILQPTKGQEYGFQSSGVVVNLALRPKFQSADIEARATATTEGGGRTENATVRYSRIRMDKILSASVSYDQQAFILESDRAGAAPVDTGGPSAFRSLTPSQRSVSATAGYSLPLGDLNLSLNVQGALGRSRTLNGFASPESDTGARSNPVTLMQDVTSRSFGASTTLDGNSGQYFWSFLINGQLAQTATRSSTGTPPDLVPTSTVGTIASNDDTRSRMTTLGATFLISGPLLSLPAGAVRFDATSDLNLISQANVTKSDPSPITTTRFQTFAIQGGLTVPLTRKDAGFLNLLGDVSFRQRLNYVQNGLGGAALTTISAVDWAPSSRLSISVSRSSSPSLPSATALLAPIVRQPGVLIFDAVTGEVVPVTAISGGRSDILRSVSSSDSIVAIYQAEVPFATASLSLTYAAARTTNPLIGFDNPSPRAQSLLPNLFVRDDRGRIVEFDSRPFTGQSEVTRNISVNLAANSRSPTIKVATTQDSTNAAVPANDVIWSINVNYSYMLSHDLSPAANGDSINLLDTPLTLSTAGSARHTLDNQLTIAKRDFGFNGTIFWQSGASLRSLDGVGSATRYSALTKISFEAFVELGRSPNLSNPGSLRLKLGIDNLFNQRLRVSGLAGLSDSAQKFLTDPFGRVIRLTFRKAL